MEELIRKMIRDLREQVEEKVQEKGTFPVVYERYENPDKALRLSHLILKVTAVPVEGKEDSRYLELAVVNHPTPYGCEKVLGLGMKQAILEVLADEENLHRKIMEAIPAMARDLEDV